MALKGKVAIDEETVKRIREVETYEI